MQTGQVLQHADLQTIQPPVVVIQEPTVTNPLIQNEIKREFKDFIILIAFILNFLTFMIVGIIGFSQGNSENIKKMNEQNEATSSGTSSYLDKSPPSVITGFFVTLGVGLIWLFLFLRFFYVILLFCIWFKCAILLVCAIICYSMGSSFYILAAVFILCFLISCIGAYALFTQRNILSLIGDLSKVYSSDRKETFLIQLFSAFLLLSLTLYFVFGFAGLMSVTKSVTQNSKYGTSTTYEIDTTYQNLGFYFIFSYIWIVFCVLHHFKYCLSNSIADWYFSGKQTIKENFIDSIYHFGTICFSSLIYMMFDVFDFFLAILVSNLRCCCCCIASLIDSFRFLLRKYLSCFVILEVGRKNQSYLESCASVSDYIANKSLQFIIFSWAGDTVAGIISSSAFWGGFVVGVLVLSKSSNLQTFFILMTIFLLIIVCSIVGTLYSSAFEIILYTFAMQIHDSQKNMKNFSQGGTLELTTQKEVVKITYVKIQEQIDSGKITYEALRVPTEHIPQSQSQRPPQPSQNPQAYQQNYAPSQNTSYSSQSQAYPQNYQQNPQFQQPYPSNQMQVPYQQQQQNYQYDQQPNNQQVKYP